MLSKVLGGSLAACMIIIVLLWHQNGNLHEDIGTAQAAVNQAVKTNSNNLATIDDLGGRLDQCVTDRQVDEAANVAVVSQLKADILGLSQAGMETRVDREEIFREPSCEELGNLDIHAVCPGLASSMRLRARSIDGS